MAVLTTQHVVEVASVPTSANARVTQHVIETARVGAIPACPLFIDWTTAAMTTAGTGPLTLAVPTNANGDLLFTAVCITGNGTTVTPPSGWEQVPSGQYANLQFYGRLASSEPASYDWNIGVSAEWVLIGHSYRPSAGSWSSVAEAIGSIRVLDEGSSTTHTVPALLTPAAIDMTEVVFGRLGRGSTTTTQPSEFFMAGNPDSGGTTTGAVEAFGAYRRISGSGPAVTWDTTNSGSSVAAHLALVDPGASQPPMIRAESGTAATSLASTTATINRPHCVAGDKIVVVMSVTNGGTITPPDGTWTQIVAHVHSGSDQLAAFTKTAGSSEAATYTFTAGASANWQVYAFTEIGTDSYVSADADDTTADSNYTAPALTMTAQTPHAIVYAAVTPVTGDGNITAGPAGYIDIYRGSSGAFGTDSTFGLAMKFETGANPGAVTFTANRTYTSGGIQIGALPPAPPEMTVGALHIMVGGGL